MTQRLQIFDSDSAAYNQSFRFFLQHTDQKTQAKRWLSRFVKLLPSRQLFLDVGAGDGTITTQLKNKFERTIAIEPNEKLRIGLQLIPGIEVVGGKLSEQNMMPPADLILCSHVFYLIEPSLWESCIHQMTTWLAENGALVIINQSRDTDCRRMFSHFYKDSPHLSSLYDKLKLMRKDGFNVDVDVVNSFITVPNIDDAYRIAEFLLSGRQSRTAPLSSQVRDYLNKNCLVSSIRYRLSCHQDFLTISRQGDHE